MTTKEQRESALKALDSKSSWGAIAVSDEHLATIRAALSEGVEEVTVDELRQIVHPDALTYYELGTILSKRFPNGLIVKKKD